MSYLVSVSFDIENASSDQYNQVKEELNDIGFSDTISGNAKVKVKLPDNTFAGEFEGSSSTKIRDDLRKQVKEIFKSLNLKAEIFIHVGGNWAWGSSSP